MFSVIRTASGQEHRILGKISLEVEYDSQMREIDFFLCPDLEQPAYFGIDFWKAFELAPEIIGLAEMEIEKIKNHFVTENHKTHPHELDTTQQKQLEEVIAMFPSFGELGLGCTSLEKHSIKLIEGAEPVKDRYYPISPAVQEIVYNEINQMLKLNVIEESESPWSNRTTVVRKPGKNRFCLDARKLNKLTVKDAYPLQNIDGMRKIVNLILHSLCQAAHYTNFASCHLGYVTPRKDYVA